MGDVTLAAVVPATNEPPTLARCLAAIEAASDRPDEVVVVDRPANAAPPTRATQAPRGRRPTSSSSSTPTCSSRRTPSRASESTTAATRG